MSPGIRRALLYGVLALCLCGFAYVQGKADATDQLTLDRAQALLGGHQGYERALEALRGREADFVRSEAFWRAKADSLSRLHAANPVGAHDSSGTGLPTSGGLQVSQNDSLRVIFLGRALDACDASRGVADSALALCRARGDSLERSLRDVLAVKECRVLFFKCPPRGAFFVVGALAGALLEHRLSH